MASINKVILVGRVGKDPEIRSMSSGDKVCSFSLATSETWKAKDTGEKQEKTTWHNIVIFNEHAVRYAENYLKKGSKVYLEGSLQTRKWTDRDGNDKYTTEIVIQRFKGELIGLDKQQSNDSTARGGPAHPEDDFNLDDDIPF